MITSAILSKHLPLEVISIGPDLFAAEETVELFTFDESRAGRQNF